jgi:hypothetical protein
LIRVNAAPPAAAAILFDLSNQKNVGDSVRPDIAHWIAAPLQPHGTG